MEDQIEPFGTRLSVYGLKNTVSRGAYMVNWE